MTEKILFVDDEPNILAGFDRQLRRRFAVETAPGGAEGLATLAAKGPFAVVVSDMRMPGMSGAEFLTKVRDHFPDTVRMLLTGYAEVQSAIEIVNGGGLFRFLTKPCPPATLLAAIEAALTQHRLVMAERELLQRTLRGSVQVLGEVLALANPAAFGRALRVQQIIRDLAKVVPGADAWEIEVAAVLSQVGYVAVPKEVLDSARKGARLSDGQQAQLDEAPRIAAALLKAIPRLEPVIEIVASQHRRFDSQPPDDSAPGRIPLGGRLLKLAIDFETCLERGIPKPESLRTLQARAGAYDPSLLDALSALLALEAAPHQREVAASDLRPGMILAENLFGENGKLILSRGYVVTDLIRARLACYAEAGIIPRKVQVLIPAELKHA